jgi:histidinol-phosphate aminotransferase
MIGEYERPTAATGGLRLHLNENTAGCSPRVLAALQELTGEDVAFYPDYAAVERETATYLGVPREQVALVNGLDEGIFVAVVAAARETVAGASTIRPEVIVPLPAFDMYGVSTSALPAEALLFVDEAYHDFCGDTALPLIANRRNVIVGRTFAKGHGLAALRAGCLIAHPDTLGRIRPIVPPYSLNVCAAAGLRAALADRGRLAWYVGQVERSREIIYDMCVRLKLTCWTSGANFVLLRVGDGAADVVAKLAARGIFIRNRSSEPGCEGCVRVTAGVVEHTVRCVTAMEEILCAGQ